MYNVNNFAEVIDKIDELIAYEFISMDDVLNSKEDKLDSISLSEIRFTIMKCFVCDSLHKCYNTGLINEFKQLNINNQYMIALYIIRGFWRFHHNKNWSIESMRNEDMMMDIVE